MYVVAASRRSAFALKPDPSSDPVLSSGLLEKLQQAAHHFKRRHGHALQEAFSVMTLCTYKRQETTLVYNPAE